MHVRRVITQAFGQNRLQSWGKSAKYSPEE